MKIHNSKKNIWLMGGFGNVLFQILALNVMSKNHDQIYIIKLLTEKNIITNFLGWTIHENLYDNLIDEKKIQEVGFFKSLIIIITGFISKKLNLKFKLSTFYNSSVKIDKNLSNNIFSYFQYNDFLKENQEELLQFGERLSLKYALKQKYPIVVHYRKGNPVLNPDEKINDASFNSYYYDEIKKMLNKESLPILIVTDNIQMLRIFFSENQNTSIISSKTALDDFKYLLSAEKLYCAPSTFSWWASHSLSSDSEVIIPKFFQENLGIFVKSNKLTII